MCMNSQAEGLLSPPVNIIYRTRDGFGYNTTYHSQGDMVGATQSWLGRHGSRVTDVQST